MILQGSARSATCGRPFEEWTATTLTSCDCPSKLRESSFIEPTLVDPSELSSERGEERQ